MLMVERKNTSQGIHRNSRVLLVNDTLGMAINALIPALLYKHTADVNVQGSDEKERKQEGKRDHQS